VLSVWLTVLESKGLHTFENEVTNANIWFLAPVHMMFISKKKVKIVLQLSSLPEVGPQVEPTAPNLEKCSISEKEQHLLNTLLETMFHRGS
jgi:hypothetical protein